MGKLRVLEILGKGQESVAGEVERWEEATIDTQPLVKVKARGKYDVVLANHVLQQVGRFEVVNVLERWGGWLAEKGELHVTVPDLMWVCESAVQEHEVDNFVLGVLYGTSEIAHRSGFSMLTLRGVLELAGLTTIRTKVGPYSLFGPGESGEVKEVIARQLYVVGMRQQ